MVEELGRVARPNGAWCLPTTPLASQAVSPNDIIVSLVDLFPFTPEPLIMFFANQRHPELSEVDDAADTWFQTMEHLASLHAATTLKYLH